MVSGDAEDHGARRLLNFGHTFGHGYEAVGGYDTWTHGEAVAAGMCRTLRWQIANGYGGTDVLARLEPLLTRYGLPTASTVTRRPCAAAWATIKKPLAVRCSWSSSAAWDRVNW